MREIRIEKLILNLCTGESGDKLTKAAKVLSDLSGQEPVESKVRGDLSVFECLAGRHATDGPEDRNRSGDDVVDSGGHRVALVECEGVPLAGGSAGDDSVHSGREH